MTTFIYALCEPDTGAIRYVGKSDRPKNRLFKHIHGSNGYRCHLGNWIKSLLSRELRPKLEILDEVPQSQWQFWEREYIRVFRAIGFRLVNTTEGGDAPPVLSGNKNPNFGKRLPAETRLKISLTKKGSVASEETKAKMRASHAGRTLSETQCAEISERMLRGVGNHRRGKKDSLETRERKSKAQKERHQRERESK